MNSLKRSASKALAWDLAGNYAGQISSFIISIFLSRLLNPSDFGLVGICLAFIGMLEIFKDFGFSSALIQRKENTQLAYNSVFYFSIASGIILTLILIAFSKYISSAYNDSRLEQLIQILSFTTFFSCFSIVHLAILSRELSFKVISTRGIVAQLIAGFVAIILAFNDFGIYALVAQQLIYSILYSFMIWLASPWRPQFQFSFKELKKLSSFSIYVFAASSVNKIIQQLDALIIGKLFSASTLGYFSRANSLNSIIIRNSSKSISAVFFPSLSKINDDDERFKKVFLRVINIVSSIAVVLTGFFYIISQELIIGLFGIKWEPAILIFEILVLKGLTYPLSTIIINAFMAKGLSKANFHYGNIRKVLQLVPFIIAYLYGFKAFLIANVAIAIASWILNHFFAHITLKIKMKEQLQQFLPQVLFILLLVVIIEFFSVSSLNYVRAGIEAMLFLLLSFVYLYFTKSPLFIEVKDFIRNLNR